MSSTFGTRRSSRGLSLIMAVLPILAGFARPVKVGASTRVGWGRPRHLVTTWHDQRKVDAALVKRERRAAKLHTAVDQGAYGLLPFVGQQGYIANTPQNCDAVQLGATVGFAIHQLQVRM